MDWNIAFEQHLLYTWLSFNFCCIMNTPTPHSIGNPSFVSWKDEKTVVVSAIIDALDNAFTLRQKRTIVLSQRYEQILHILDTYHTNGMSFSECLRAIQPLTYIWWEDTINTYITILNTLNPDIHSHEKIFSAIGKKLSQLIKSDEMYKPLLLDTLVD